MNMLKVEGMHCQNCVRAVKEALEALPGARGIEVCLEKGEVKWQAMGVDIEAIKTTIEDIGFEAHECCDQGQCSGH